MVLATTLILQSNPFSLVQAKSNSQDANQLSAFSPTASPSISSLEMQAILKCLNGYQIALQNQLPQEEQLFLRSEAIAALEYLENAFFWPNTSEMESLIQTIGSIRQLDADFPIYQPHKISGPKRSEMTRQSFSLINATPSIDEPSLSLLEASHTMESASLPNQSAILKKDLTSYNKVETPSLNQKDSTLDPNDKEVDTTSTSRSSEFSLNPEADSASQDQSFIEFLDSQEAFKKANSSFSDPFEDSSDVQRSENPENQDDQLPFDSSFISQEPASIELSNSGFFSENFSSADSNPTAVTIIEANHFDPRITADLNEDLTLRTFRQQSLEEATSVTPEEMPAQSDISSEPILDLNGMVQTIDPITEEPTLGSSMEEMPIDEGLSSSSLEDDSNQEPSLENLDSSISSQDSILESNSSSKQDSNAVKPSLVPVLIQEEVETQIDQPISDSIEPAAEIPPVEIMEEEPDLAFVPSTFSIFDYISKSSSLLEVIYPGLGIGPIPILSVAALPAAIPNHLNQNPKNFEDADDVAAEGRPYTPLNNQEEEMTDDDSEILGIPEEQADFEEVFGQDQNKDDKTLADPTSSKNPEPNSPNNLPNLPESPEEPKNPSSLDDSQTPQDNPSNSFPNPEENNSKPSEPSKPMEDSKDPTPIDSGLTIIDISDNQLDFDVMPDFDPSIIGPAPANPLLPGTPEPMDTASNQQQLVDAWASVPSVSTPTLTQSIKVRQLTKKENRRLKIGDLGFIMLLPNYEDTFAWKKAASPYNTPLLWGQCTWFAWGRFYDLYGYSPGFSGNGYECVSQLLSVHGDKFSFSKTPASGAVFSSDVAHNHVGIVLEYDEEKDLLTIQEGNLDGISNANWDEAIADYRTLRLSSSDMRTLYGDVTYAIPKENTKFVGYEETKKALEKESSQVNSTKNKDLSSINFNSLRSVCFNKLKSFLFLWEEMEELPSKQTQVTQDTENEESSEVNEWKDDDFLSMDDL